MIDATILRVRLHDLACVGRSRLGTAAWGPVPKRPLRAVSPVAMAAPSVPGCRRAPEGQLSPGPGDLVAAIIPRDCCAAPAGIPLRMARKGWWRRTGSKGRFRYLDASGREITDEEQLERIRALAIPPAWKDVWIAPGPRSKIQATGVDTAGRKQYRYSDAFRERQEQAKYDRLIRFAEGLPQLREAMAEHIARDDLSCERVCAVAVRLINLGWFRVGSERYAKRHRTFGITTLRKSHVTVRGSRIAFRYRGKNRTWVRTALVDAELADAVRELRALPGRARLFRYEREGELFVLDNRKLNEYLQEYLGEEFSAKDFRTWGGTMLAAIAFAEAGPPAGETDAKRKVAAVMRAVGERLGNTPAVARSSYVSPAVVDQYLDGRTIDDFRPRHFRIVGARETSLDPEERAVLSLLRSWRIRQAREAA
jgi:DNA topoisomerase-1